MKKNNRLIITTIVLLVIIILLLIYYNYNIFKNNYSFEISAMPETESFDSDVSVEEPENEFIDISELDNEESEQENSNSDSVTKSENSSQNSSTLDNSSTSSSSHKSSNTLPYYIKVNILGQVVTIYGKDNDGNYTKPIKAMVCSTGTYTPQSGIYSIPARWTWLGLKGNVYGQYATQIKGNILFHSVPYLTKYDPESLEYWEYDKLGTAASLRLC